MSKFCSVKPLGVNFFFKIDFFNDFRYVENRLANEWGRNVELL